MNPDRLSALSASRPVLVAVLSIAIQFFWTASVSAESGTAPPSARWFERSLVGIEVGPTGAQFGGEVVDYGYASRFNGRDIVRKAVEANCEYLVIWARDGEYAYYNSKVVLKAHGLRDRDPLRETMDEAAKHKLPVIAYCVVQYGSRALREHPEYRMVGPDGKPFDRVCFNTGYRELVKQILAEIAAYGVVGFHVDMMDQGFGPPYGCWCENCRKRFQAKYGRPMPKGVTWDEDWDRMLDFRYDTSAEFEKELTAYIRSLNPKLTADFNYHGNPPFSWEVGQRPVQHAGNSDFVTGETGMWGFSALTVGLNARFYAAATPGVPYQVAMSRDVRIYHNQTTRPLNDMRWELLTLLAHGAFVTMIDKTAYDGGLDPVAYERIGAAFQEARTKREHFGHKPVMEVGIYFSSRTRDWYGREKPGDYFQSFQGAHKAMVYEHIPWGVVLDENADIDTLKQFDIVCLPNAAILSPAEVSLLQRYVQEGGRLIVTGLSGLLGRHGEPLKETVLAELVGATLVGRLNSLDNHVRFPRQKPAMSPMTTATDSGPAPAEPACPHAGQTGLPATGRPAGHGSAVGRARVDVPGRTARFGNRSPALSMLHDGIPLDWPFLVKGPAAIFKPTTAVAIGELMKPHRTVRQQQGKESTEWPMSADAPVGPAILVNTVGKGTVLTFTCSPDFATAGEHHLVEDRRLIRNAVRFLQPKPRVEIAAPAHVETVVTDDAATRTLRVHLIGYLSPPATTPPTNRPYVLPSLIEDLPSYRATVRVDCPVKEAKAFNASTTLQQKADRIEAFVNDIHEILLIRY